MVQEKSGLHSIHTTSDMPLACRPVAKTYFFTLYSCVFVPTTCPREHENPQESRGNSPCPSPPDERTGERPGGRIANGRRVERPNRHVKSERADDRQRRVWGAATRRARLDSGRAVVWRAWQHGCENRCGVSTSPRARDGRQAPGLHGETGA